MERIRGVVERITYANEENGYSVIKIKAKGHSDLITVVGSMASVPVGTVIEAKGSWVRNPTYGLQFQASEWQERLPADIYGIEKYLGSGLIKGIGPVFAGKIVRCFGERTLDVLEETPEQLLDVEGIGPKRVDMIKTAWQEQKEIKNVMLFLQSHGISTAYGTRIFRTYGQDSIAVVKENPYRLADDIFGIGFKTADNLAQKLGIDRQASVRCRSGVLYVLRRLADEGHCFAFLDQLADSAVDILEIEKAKVLDTIERAVEAEDLMADGDAYYLPPFYYSEVGTARRLAAIASGVSQEPLLKPPPTAQRTTVEYDPVQLRAIALAERSRAMVLTGGPGTGKTTTINGIIEMHRGSKRRVILAAPTGRAAKRMTEATGMEAKTIHRLLEFSPSEGWKRNEDNPLEGDVLIIDEASMVDIILMYNLLKAVPENMSLVVVGDVDQLPSVGPGSVLRDIIASETIPVIRLNRIFRQALDSDIIVNAHRINRGQQPQLRRNRSSNFFLLEEQEDIAGTVVDLCSRRLPRFYNLEPIQDIQVLTPMQRTETGAMHLNKLLQEALNPETRCLKRGGAEYRLHDKVMQLRNNYEKEVFNGDIGRVSGIDLEDKTLQVRFDDRTVDYAFLELDELVLAYATTIHKAQGSEFPVVVMPFSFSHWIMLQRNLLYTGITRAKELVVLVGDKKAVYAAVKHAEVRRRNTRLKERLQALLS